MKKEYKIYLEESDYRKLKEKALSLFTGRGALSHYIEKVSQEDIIFLDSNIKKTLSLFAITARNKPESLLIILF
jgi:hypothetical protein